MIAVCEAGKIYCSILRNRRSKSWSFPGQLMLDYQVIWPIWTSSWANFLSLFDIKARHLLGNVCLLLLKVNFNDCFSRPLRSLTNTYHSILLPPVTPNYLSQLQLKTTTRAFNLFCHRGVIFQLRRRVWISRHLFWSTSAVASMSCLSDNGGSKFWPAHLRNSRYSVSGLKVAAILN